MAQIIACCAQKGGCAKTVTVHNLSTAFKRMGKSVLAVDFDTQASLTTCFGLNPDRVPVNIADLMDVQIHDEELPSRSEYIHHCGGVDLIPSSAKLSAVSEIMHHEIGCERFLYNILEPLRNSYDYILVDTGPKLDNLSINALIAADQLLIPVNPQFLSTAGLQALLKTVTKVQRRFNPQIKISGILLTMCEQRTNLCKIISSQIREEYQDTVPVFSNSIPMSVKIGEAVYYSQSVIDYAPKSKVALSYQSFAEELDWKINNRISISEGREENVTKFRVLKRGKEVG
jgi:chromosome partitioning protein